MRIFAVQLLCVIVSCRSTPDLDQLQPRNGTVRVSVKEGRFNPYQVQAGWLVLETGFEVRAVRLARERGEVRVVTTKQYSSASQSRNYSGEVVGYGGVSISYQKKKVRVRSVVVEFSDVCFDKELRLRLWYLPEKPHVRKVAGLGCKERSRVKHGRWRTRETVLVFDDNMRPLVEMGEVNFFKDASEQ